MILEISCLPRSASQQVLCTVPVLSTPSTGARAPELWSSSVSSLIITARLFGRVAGGGSTTCISPYNETGRGGGGGGGTGGGGVGKGGGESGSDPTTRRPRQHHNLRT